jgi:UDP-N-acetyl-D-galactosamine dehydrogenase
MSKYKIAVIGLGYVGLPLAAAFAEIYQVVGYDISTKRISELNKFFDSTNELNTDELEAVSNNIMYTDNSDELDSCNIYIITVPTPIDSSNLPDLSPLEYASKVVAGSLAKHDIVIYESTVYPGVTEDVCVPILERLSGLKFNSEFFCGYSPERINPGDKKHTIKNILKVTSGSTPEIAMEIDDLYRSIITAGTYLASSIKVAEASKVIENTQRDVNIALINELSMIFDTMGLNTKEVIEAAATKWNFIELYPGLVGGHCIGVDPYYLTFKALEMGYKPNLILDARQINNSMAKYISDATIKHMILNDVKVKNSEVLVMGLTFKENCPDLRNSKVFDIIDELSHYKCNVDVYEPWVESLSSKLGSNFRQVSNPFNSDKMYDAVIVTVGHDSFKVLSADDIYKILNKNHVLIDVKNIYESSTWTL